MPHCHLCQADYPAHELPHALARGEVVVFPLTGWVFCYEDAKAADCWHEFQRTFECPDGHPGYNATLVEKTATHATFECLDCQARWQEPLDAACAGESPSPEREEAVDLLAELDRQLQAAGDRRYGYASDQTEAARALVSRNGHAASGGWRDVPDWPGWWWLYDSDADKLFACDVRRDGGVLQAYVTGSLCPIGPLPSGAARQHWLHISPPDTKVVADRVRARKIAALEAELATLKGGG